LLPELIEGLDIAALRSKFPATRLTADTPTSALRPQATWLLAMMECHTEYVDAVGWKLQEKVRHTTPLLSYRLSERAVCNALTLVVLATDPFVPRPSVERLEEGLGSECSHSQYVFFFLDFSALCQLIRGMWFVLSLAAHWKSGAAAGVGSVLAYVYWRIGREVGTALRALRVRTLLCNFLSLTQRSAGF
jgi:hypothetical protein